MTSFLNFKAQVAEYATDAYYTKNLKVACIGAK